MKGGKKLTLRQVKEARDLMIKQQGYKCLLCGCDFQAMTMKGRKRVPKYQSTLDHCHDHGHVRGVLCINCNGREGEIKNRANRCKRDGTGLEWLRRLVDYLEKHETPQSMYIHPEHKTEDEKRLDRNAKERKRRADMKAKAMIRKTK